MGNMSVVIFVIVITVIVIVVWRIIVRTFASASLLSIRPRAAAELPSADMG